MAELGASRAVNHAEWQAAKLAIRSMCRNAVGIKHARGPRDESTSCDGRQSRWLLDGTLLDDCCGPTTFSGRKLIQFVPWLSCQTR